MHKKLRTRNRKAKKRKRNAGFTLSEVVMASALLIISLVPILKALTTSHVTNAIVERRTRSLILAQGKLERIKAQTINGYDATYTETNTTLDGSYLCNVTDSAMTSDLRQITIEVGFDQSGNSTLESGEVEVTLATLIAKRS
jgi:Tfp pilus assembly protein PilV